MAASPEVIAALAGAGAGLLSSILVEVGRWFFGRRRRAKAIKIALYYEIFRHHIFEATPEDNGDPNFMIVGFSRAAYDAYLDEIPDLLPQKLVGEISMYYADVTAAAAQQARIDEDAGKVRDAARELIRLQMSSNPIVTPDEMDLAHQEGLQVAHRMEDMKRQTRHLLGTAMWQKERVMPSLRKELKNDPTKEPVNVLPKYREWFDREARERGLTPIKNGDE
ncbi:MAG TPA: hypothetical protein VEK77_10130 [Gemmatimonadales bacterium]|nr:hypothetical protein [Gemmatimonadales bacterium]